MATTQNVTTSYAGKYAGEYLRSAFLANDTLQHITVKENIDYRAVVKKLVNDISFAAPTCAWTPTGEVNITERWLTLKKFQVQEDLCLNEFLNDWAAGDVQRGRLEPALSENFIMNMMEGIAAENETQIWTGNGSLATQYDGLLQLIGQDADNDIIFAPTPVAITKANVFAKIEEVIALMPTAVKYANEKPTIYMGADVWESFMNASMATGNGWYAYGGAAVPKTWMGTFNIAVCPGLPASSLIFARKSNLWFGTNLFNDWNNIQVVDMTQFGEDNFRFNAKFFAGAQYGIGSEIVAYSTWF
jgi:hypothetical protein